MAHCSVTGGDRWYAADRLGGLRRFAIAITILNILGHSWFGFEQSYAQPLVGLAAAYGMELLLETIEALAVRRRPKYVGGVKQFVEFLLPAHISGLAVSMLLYSNERLGPIALAAAIAIASKSVFRVPYGNGMRHVFNPSNFGISITLLLLPWVGIAPPYHFTENLGNVGDWVLPVVIICSGSFLNTCFTKRLPLIVTWLTCFAAQAVVRHFVFDSSLTAALMPMSGVAFLLYTFYMVTDPPTTPSSVRGQVAFGAAVATTYGLLMVSHIVFGLFFALTTVSTLRAAYLYARAYLTQPSAAPAAQPSRPQPHLESAAARMATETIAIGSTQP